MLAHLLSIIKKYPLLILILIVIFPLFYNLADLTIRMWDESRLVVNALEMHKNGNLLVTHFDGAPDMWNTKPPLMIWVHLLLIQFLGNHEYSFRLGSAIFGLLTCVYLYRLVFKNSNQQWIAIAAVLMLISTRGFVDSHITRTGDYDALLILWAVMAMGALYRYCTKGYAKYLYIFALFLGLGVLTKGPAIMLFGPAVLLYIIVTKNGIRLLKDKHTYLAILVFFLIALPYYFIRERYNPGYLQAVYENELGGRFLETLEDRSGPWYYYLEWMAGRNFTLWMGFALIGMVYFIREKRPEIKQIVLWALSMAGGYLLMISISQTKLLWYAAPIYPFLAIIAAYGINSLYITLQSKVKSNKKWTIPMTTGLLFMVAYIVLIVENINDRKFKDYGKEVYDMAYYIRDIYPAKKVLHKTIYIWESDYVPSSYLYFQQLRDQGTQIIMVEEETLPPQGILWLQNDSLYQVLRSKHGVEMEVVDSFYVFKEIIIR